MTQLNTTTKAQTSKQALPNHQSLQEREGPLAKGSAGANHPQGQLIAAGLPIVHAHVKRMSKRFRGHFEECELTSVGMGALVEALRRFDPSRSQFRSFLIKLLNWRMVSAARKHARRMRNTKLDRCSVNRQTAPTVIVRVPANKLPTQGTVWLSTSMVCERDNPEQAAIKRSTRKAVWRAVQRLPQPARQLIERHYFGGERFDLMARELGISKASVSRMHKAATRTLARNLRALGPDAI